MTATMNRQRLFSACLFLAGAFCFQLEMLNNQSGSLGVAAVHEIIPERIRGFIAARLWERADLYMHAGPSGRLPENFVAGSYAGNTDLLPVLQIITRLTPEVLPPWLLLAANLGRHLQQKEKAMMVLKRAIGQNPDHSRLHELYAAIAYLKIFMHKPEIKDKISAINYLQKAIKIFPQPVSHEELTLPGYGLKDYKVLIARLYVEVNKPQKALEAWVSSGLSLEDDQSKLAAALKKYQDQGILPDPDIFTFPDEAKRPANHAEKLNCLIDHPSHNHTSATDSDSGTLQLFLVALWLLLLQLLRQKRKSSIFAG
jgi:tetratricopeptide (TPR) repeat protein